MKTQFGKFVGRVKSLRRNRTNRLQQLRLEALEARRLLAFDVPNPYQNDLIAEDVSGDYNVAPLDALLVVNAINGGKGGKLPEVEPGRKADGPLFDVNGDNYLTALDALIVANYLNGEGETTPVAEFTYQFIDSTGAPLTNNQVVVGDIFQLQTFVRDTRGFSAAGINAAYLDIAFDNDAAFDVAVGEIQSLKFFVDKLDVTQTSSSFTLTFDGQTTAPIALFSSGSPRSDSAIAADMQDKLEALSNVGVGNVTAVVDQAAKAEDQQNGVPRFNFEIRFGNQLAGQDLPLISLDDSNVAVVPNSTFDFAIAEVLAGDQSTPEAEASAFIFADLYDFARRSAVTSNEFDDVGAASQEIPLPSPSGAKLLFTVPLIATAPGVINFTPNQADNPPSTDIVTGVTVIPPSMVSYGDVFSLTVISDPTAPVAVDDTVAINEDTSLTLNGNVTVNDVVEPGRTLSIDSVGTTANTLGSVNGLVYTPPANYFGPDEITYSVRDSSGLISNVATVTINVNAVNDAPTAVDDSFDVDENSADNDLDVLDNDSGGPGEGNDVLTIVAVSSTTNGGTVSIAADGFSVIYTPATDYIGPDSFTYTIEDQGGLSDTATVTIDVEAGVLPSARRDTATTQEDVPVSIDVLANDRVNPESLAILLSASNGSFGTVAIDDGGTPGDLTDDEVVYTPNSKFYGTDVFTYIMNDTSELGEDSTGTVTVTIENVNDPPILVDDLASATEDVAATIAVSTLLANDSPGLGEDAASNANPQTLTLTSVSSASAGGSVELVGQNVIYTPAQNFNGTFLFTYVATDDGIPPLSGRATVTVTVAAVNDPPVANPDQVSTDEDVALDIPVADLLANDLPGPPDEGNQQLTMTGVSPTSSQGGTVSLVGDTVTYVPAQDFFGTDTFTYTISDGQLEATGTVTVEVAPINDPPIAGPDFLNGFNQQDLIIPVEDLLANDSPGPANESDQTLSIIAVTPTADTNGTVVLNNDGTITYTPDDDFVGQATFFYTLQDSGPGEEPNQNTAEGLVTINVEAFRPSVLGGIVWVDETGDGIIDADERRLGAVKITLSGVSLGQTIPTQTVMTLSDGSYSFENLAPGRYVVSYDQPFMYRDGVDVPGAGGDLDTIENQFTIDIAQPGGLDGGDYHFAALGLDTTYGRTIDQLASRYVIMNPSLAYNGAYFGVGPNNELLWTAKMDGFDDAVFTEAVISQNGAQVLMTYVDAAGKIFTAQLGRGDFVHTTDANGNAIVRVLGTQHEFDWQEVSLAAPPYSVRGYLDSIDEIFAQEGW